MTKTNTDYSAPSALGRAVPYLFGLAILTWYFAPLAWLESGTIPSVWPSGWQGPWTVWMLGSSCRIWSTNPWYTDLILAPLGAALHGLPLGEAVALPARCLLGSVVSTTALYSFLCLIAFFLNFSAAFSLFGMLSRSGWIALILALGYSFHPFFLEHLRAGDLSSLFAFPLILYLQLLLIALEFPARMPRIRPYLGLILIVLAFSDIYYLFFAAIITLFIGVVLVRGKVLSGRWYLAAVASPWAVTLALGSVKFLPIVRALFLEHALTEVSSPLTMSADIVSFLVPGSSQLIGSFAPLLDITTFVMSRQGEVGTYLGYALFFGVALSMWAYRKVERRHPLVRALPWLALLLFTISCGPAFQWQGSVLATNPLFLALSRGLPLVPGAPARFVMVAVLLLCMTLALHLPGLMTTLAPQRRRLIAGALVGIAVLEYFPSPITVSSFHSSETLVELRDFRTVHSVLDLDDHAGATLARQIYHGKRMVGGPRAITEGPQGDWLRDNFFLSWVNEGISSNPEIVYRDLKALQIQAILVPVTKTETIQRLAGFPSLQKIMQDREYALFIVND